MIVIDLAMVFSRAPSSATGSLNRDRIATLNPVGYVNVMYMLFDNMIPTKPVKVIPVAHLIFHFRLSLLTRAYPNAATVPVNLSGNDITKRTVLNPLDRFAIICLIAPLQAYHHIQFLALRFFSGG